MTVETAAPPRLLSASTIIGDPVRNAAGENLGQIEELMIDLPLGKVGYAVLSFGGLFGLGKKLFAIPWQALRLDADNRCFILDVDKQKLETAPGFDQDNWPEVSDPTWGRSIYAHYGYQPYW